MKKALRIAAIVVGSIAAIAAINFAPMVSLKTPGMREYVANGIRVYAVAADEAETGRVTRRIVQQSARITSSLGAEAADDIAIIIYPDRTALHRKTIGLAGMLLPDWFIGDNTREFVLITSPAQPGPAHTRDSIEQAAVHEYVHLLTDRRNRDLGYWLKEGIALYLAGQVPGVESIRWHRDITWAEYATPGALRFAEVGGYTLAYTLVDYLARKHGWDTVVALTAPGASFESVLGLGEREIFDAWRTELQRL